MYWNKLSNPEYPFSCNTCKTYNSTCLECQSVDTKMKILKGKLAEELISSGH